MQKSFIERVFPSPKQPILPQYDDRVTLKDERATNGLDTKLSSTLSTPRSSRRSSGSKTSLKAAPLSASIIHHEDPFLAVDRAAQNLQKTIQSLLDFQSQFLSGRTSDESSDTVSQQNQLPVSSTDTTSVYSQSISGAVPIRQPPKKGMTLRGVRRGLVKSMHDFAALKEEELRTTEDERARRQTALGRVSDLETRKQAVKHEILTLKDRSSNVSSHDLRSEAQAVEQEIHELEGRLMELKAKHRHLIIRAEQFENSAASELSSYEGTLALLNKETKAFLRQPPVKQALSSRHPTQSETDMFVLTPDRRTLDMAKDQWTNELGILESHKNDVQRDQQALLEGAKIWKDTITKVTEFEQQLRSQMKPSHNLLTNDSNQSPISDILTSLDSTSTFLEQQLTKAESQNWNLLICAIGAELEAFKQARALLAPNEPAPVSPLPHNPSNERTTLDSEDEKSDISPTDLLSNGDNLMNRMNAAMASPLITTTTTTASTHNDQEASNESLKATLKNFPQPQQKPIPSPTADTDTNINPSSNTQQRSRTYSESEDDDPGPEFLISHH